MTGVHGCRPAGEPEPRLDQRPVEAAPVVRDEPGVRRDPALDLRRAAPRSSAWSGRSSWVCRKAVPSQRARPTRKASVPGRRGEAGRLRVQADERRRCRRMARQQGEAVPVERDLERRDHPPHEPAVGRVGRVGTEGARQPHRQLAAPAPGERRAGRQLVRSGSRPTRSRQRRPEVREPALAGDGRQRLGGHATAASAGAGRPGACRRRRAERREEPQRQRLAVHLGLEARSRAGRAPRVAGARPDEVGGTGHQLVVARPEAFRQPHAAGHRLVEVDRGRLVVGRAHLGHEAEVARVHHQQHRRHGLDRAAGADQRHVQLVPPPAPRRLLGGEPVGGGLELDLGQVDRSPANVLVGAELELLVQGDQAGDHDLAVDPGAAGGRGGREHVERLEGHGPVGVGVVVRVDLCGRTPCARPTPGGPRGTAPTRAYRSRAGGPGPARRTGPPRRGPLDGPAWCR